MCMRTLWLHTRIMQYIGRNMVIISVQRAGITRMVYAVVCVLVAGVNLLNCCGDAAVPRPRVPRTQHVVMVE